MIFGFRFSVFSFQCSVFGGSIGGRRELWRAKVALAFLTPRDKSRSLGFSPGRNFSSSLKFPVLFRGWGRAGMLGLPFVLGVIPGRPQ